jgi:multidrug resistance efflux pump
MTDEPETLQMKLRAAEAEIERLQHNQMTVEYNVIAKTAAMHAQRAEAAGRALEASISRSNMLISALNSALALQDAMLTEISHLKRPGDPPPIQIITAKNNFDTAMKKLLGYTESPPAPPPLIERIP